VDRPALAVSSTLSTPRSTGLPGALAAIGVTLGDLATTRAELFALELREEARRGIDLVALGVAVTAFLHLALLMATVFVVAAFWDTHRLLACGAMAVLYGACAVALFFRLRARASGMQDAFAATREEFREDLAGLRGRS
jgi:uncharacterized membrane protein YqjE